MLNAVSADPLTLARDVYREFKAKPESQHIASRFALEQLSALLARIKPARVLEVGAGIGTITALLLRPPNRPVSLTVTEDHPVCLRELARNIDERDSARYRIIHTPAELDRAAIFDLVIFDGTLDDDLQYTVFQPGTWCFVEGARLATRLDLNRKLAPRRLTIDFTEKTPGSYKLKWKGRYRLFGKVHHFPKIVPNKGCSFGVVKALGA